MVKLFRNFAEICTDDIVSCSVSVQILFLNVDYHIAYHTVCKIYFTFYVLIYSTLRIVVVKMMNYFCEKVCR